MLSICFKLWGKYREKNNPWSKSQNVEKAYLSIPLGKHCGQLTAWTQPPSGPVPTSGQAGYSRCQPGRRDLATGCPLKPLPHPRSCPLPQRCQLPPWLSGDANGVSKTASERNRVNTRQTQDWERRLVDEPHSSCCKGWAASMRITSKRSESAHLRRRETESRPARPRVRQGGEYSRKTLGSFPNLALPWSSCVSLGQSPTPWAHFPVCKPRQNQLILHPGHCI